MKKIISLILALTLVLGMVFTLASCGKMLSGKYQSGITTYDFAGNKVTVTYEILGFQKSIEGTYKIAETDEGKMTITFTFEGAEEGSDEYAGEFAFAEGTENGEDYIKIGLLKYTKVK